MSRIDGDSNAPSPRSDPGDPLESSLRSDGLQSSCEGVTHEGSPTKAHTRRHTLLIEEPQSLPAMPLERLRRAPNWAVAVNNIAFMAVPRSIPANFAATGWVIGILALVYSSVVTYDTGLVIGQLCGSSGATSFPELAAEAMGRFSARHGWSEGRRALGRRLAHGLTLSMQFATYYLAEVCELIYFEQYFGQIFGASPLCQWQWLLVGALIALPAMQVHLQPDTSRLQPDTSKAATPRTRCPPSTKGGGSRCCWGCSPSDSTCSSSSTRSRSSARGTARQAPLSQAGLRRGRSRGVPSWD